MFARDDDLGSAVAPALRRVYIAATELNWTELAMWTVLVWPEADSAGLPKYEVADQDQCDFQLNEGKSSKYVSE